MFKLVVLLSVAAIAMANPGVVVPGGRSVSQYGSRVVHGSPVVYGAPAVYSSPAAYGPSEYGASVYGGHAVVPVHHLHKRSVTYNAVSPASYGNPVVSAAYPAVRSQNSNLPVVSAYSSVYPNAFSVHRY